jgi:mono/diheme cytochrome c family protein
MSSLLLLCSLIFFASLGCQKTVAPSVDSASGGHSEPKTQTAAELAARGKIVYQQNCTACHAPDPRMAGALGPELAKSSLDLIQSRVMSATYPKDYKPKRETKIMQPLPHLKDDVPALHAYLNSL